MPMLPKEALDEFKMLWKKNFGQDITDAYAHDHATRLLNLYRIVYGTDLIYQSKQESKNFCSNDN